LAQFAPQLGAQADNEVHAADRRARLAQVGQPANELARIAASMQVKLQVSVRRRAEREDPGLRRVAVSAHSVAP
jgi:hypothetical protein